MNYHLTHCANAPLRRTDDQGRFKPDATNHYVGLQLRTVRRLLGLSRVALASRFGACPELFADFERGSREVPTELLARIAHSLNKPLLWFVGCSHEHAMPRELRVP